MKFIISPTLFFCLPCLSFQPPLSLPRLFVLVGLPLSSPLLLIINLSCSCFLPPLSVAKANCQPAFVHVPVCVCVCVHLYT